VLNSALMIYGMRVWLKAI